MYDPAETDISKKFLLQILDKAAADAGLIGGWAVYLYVNESFTKATGKEYLRSRDIDVFVNCKKDVLERLKKTIFSLGFAPSGYEFRYQLIIDRNTLKPIEEAKATQMPMFELIYVFLDVFGDRKNKILPLWENEFIKKIIKEKAILAKEINGKAVSLPAKEYLLAMKCESFLQREDREKRLKDACDIYALLFYSGMEKVPREAKKAIEGMLSEDILEFIAQELFGDRYKSGLVRRNLMSVL